VESAVKDGVITQAQADQILSRPQPGMFGGGPGGLCGRGGPGGPGGGPGGPGGSGGGPGGRGLGRRGDRPRSS
jgi:hypothetical protein